MSAHTMQRLTHTDLLIWFAPPAAIFFIIALACVAPSEPCPPGESCTTLSPAQQEMLEEAENQLLGTWELVYMNNAPDDVERPLFAGSSRWELEIFEVRAISSTNFSWRGAIKSIDACLVTQDSFDAQSTECDTLSPVTLGRCSGHSCDKYVEQEVEGRYDIDAKILSTESQTGDIYFLNPQQGYINISTSIDFEMLVRDGAGSEAECKGGWGCEWNVSIEGLYQNTYRNYRADERTMTFNRINDNSRPSDSEISDDKQVVPIGSQDAVEEILLGDWNVRIQLEGTDDVDRPVLYGDVHYRLNIFEVTPTSLVGTWDFKAGLNAKSICFASIDAAEAGTYDCDTYNNIGMGNCSGAGCTDRGETALEGRYRDLDGSFSIEYNNSYKDADSYYFDEQGYIYSSIPIDVSSTLIGQTLASTPCETPGSLACEWVVNSAGTYAETYGSKRGDANYFEMSR